jgi:preprotein translocase subunit Sec63
MAKYDDITEARTLLGLGEAVTLKEIKSAYRSMASRYHPDKHSSSDSSEYEEIMKKLNWAYKVLLEYCHDYKFTFREIDVLRTYTFDEYIRRYYDGWF